eukprot:747706-Hanusia_phi.AAC.6
MNKLSLQMTSNRRFESASIHGSPYRIQRRAGTARIGPYTTARDPGVRAPAARPAEPGIVRSPDGATGPGSPWPTPSVAPVTHAAPPRFTFRVQSSGIVAGAAGTRSGGCRAAEAVGRGVSLRSGP